MVTFGVCCSTTRRICFIFLIVSLSHTCFYTTAAASDEDDNNLRSTARSSTSNEHIDSISLGSIEPRQYFKIHVAPKKSLKHNAHSLRRAITGNQNQQQNPSLSKQKISNATLKKLLNQSMLLKSLNSNSSSSSLAQQLAASSDTAGAGSKPSFKFVFIQRATASPSAHNKQQKFSANGVQSSLAASVSKHLANSLINTAANMVDNLQASSKPSLSVLASQLSGRNSTTATETSSSSSPSTTPAPAATTDTQSANETANKSITSSTSEQLASTDIKRLQPDKRKHTIGAGIKKGIKQPGSKIYNLPVKFVSNGQPNSVMFSTIKHHLATIKKLQSVANMAASLAIDQNQVASVKRRKQGELTRLKGNSRFIYLPLKYLSNARPNKIIISKATHKSSVNN